MNKVDNTIINLILTELYKDGSKQGLLMDNEILVPNGINLDENQIIRMKKILLTTNFIGISEDFIYDPDYPQYVENGKIHLTPEGIEMMLKYGSYHDYLKKGKKEESNKSIERRLKNSYLITAIFFAIFSIILGFNSSSNKKEVDELIINQKKLLKEIDSLKIIKNK